VDSNSVAGTQVGLSVDGQTVKERTGMKHWTAIVVAIMLASFPGVLSAQVNCNAVPYGPERTDCYLGLSQFYRAQSDLAAARARAQSDAAWYRAITGAALQSIKRIGDDN
jgi:hypothetical protein